MSETFFIKLNGPELSFCSSHFILLPSGQCEALHGHDFRVEAEISGSIDDKGLVVDFLEVHQALQAVVAELDHCVLLPESSPAITVKREENTFSVECQDRKWLLPAADCLVLPVVNTTTELIAGYIARRMVQAAAGWPGAQLTTIKIAVEEAPGQWAGCEMQL